MAMSLSYSTLSRRFVTQRNTREAAKRRVSKPTRQADQGDMYQGGLLCNSHVESSRLHVVDGLLLNNINVQ
jgi:hypothetical protein